MSSKISYHNDGCVDRNLFHQQAGPARCEHLSKAWRYS